VDTEFQAKNTNFDQSNSQINH